MNTRFITFLCCLFNLASWAMSRSMINELVHEDQIEISIEPKNKYGLEILKAMENDKDLEHLSSEKFPHFIETLTKFVDELGLPKIKISLNFTEKSFCAADDTLCVGIHPDSMLFDQQFSDEDIECILAHELGHLKLRHESQTNTLNNTAIRLVKLLCGTALCCYLFQSYMDENFILWSSLLISSIGATSSVLFEKLGATYLYRLLMRQAEFEADKIKAQLTSVPRAVNALRKTYQNTLETVYKPALHKMQDKFEESNGTSNFLNRNFYILEYVLNKHESEKLTSKLGSLQQVVHRIKVKLSQLFSTHPSYDERIKAIEENSSGNRVTLGIKNILGSCASFFGAIGLPVKNTL